MRRLNVLTWHTHGSYLHYLTHVPHEFHVLSRPDRRAGYAGRSGQFPWRPNVHDLPVADAASARIDCIVFQDDPQYLEDQYRYLSAAQRRLPRIYIEHDPPRSHPTDARHPVSERDVVVVHVTAFNRLMWDNAATPTRVIEHGVPDPRVPWRGDVARGITVVNDLRTRGRRLGHDIFEQARARVPLDLVGMGAADCGGLGEIPHAALPAFLSRYRFFFNPIRYTSMGLAVIEAMLCGLPIVALATTEMATVVRNGSSGCTDTDPEKLVQAMQQLLHDPGLARSLGEAARRDARERFGIDRFVRDWEDLLRDVAG